MKITCTLSEYTKLARQCGELKARFNCRNCPLNGVVDLPEGESCDVERFVRAIDMPDSAFVRALAEEKSIPMPETEMPEGCIHVTVPRARGERLETR